MDPISMMLGSRMTEAMNRVMMDASSRMTDLSHKMLKVGHEVAQIGKEMGKGQLLDVSG
jgi:hypothetical protein